MAKSTEGLALVGSDTLAGREIRDLMATGAPDMRLDLIAAEGEQAGVLTRLGDEPALTRSLDAAGLEDASVLILAGSPESSLKALELAAPGTLAIDLTFAAEERPDARLRAPSVEEESDTGWEDAKVHVIAHPAAIALAMFLRRLHERDPIRRSVIQIFAPASDRGAAGVEELQQQTISLLSFKNMPRAVFDTQLSFNMLAKYGEEAPIPLEETELRIERHLASLLALPGEGEGAPMPSLRVIQAPVFHGYSFSAWVEFDSLASDLEALESGLVAGSIEVRSGEFEPPTNVGQAGQSGITVGAIAPDRNEPDAFWFWIVTDNLRLAAENAVAVARQLAQ